MTRRIGVLCPSCGAPLGGRDGCQSHFDDLSAQAWNHPVRGAMHNLVVDAYALQHPDEYCESAKSYAAHLTGLCCGVEHPGDQKLYWQIARWLDGPATIEKPAVLDARGRQTIATIVNLPDDAYRSAVRQWALSVWTAYESQQYLARTWLAEVLGHANRTAKRFDLTRPIDEPD
jgi:hypothetical protein